MRNVIGTCSIYLLQPLEEAGYSIMPSEDGEDEDFTVGERVVPAQNRKDEAGEEQELLQKTPQDYPLRVRKGSARSRRGTVAMLFNTILFSHKKYIHHKDK